MFELILLILFVFFVGCILGYLLHRVVAPHPSAQNLSPDRDESDAQDSSDVAKVAKLKVPTAAVPSAVPRNEPDSVDARTRATPKRNGPTGSGTPPKGLPAPRGGSPDPLQRISGVGPKIESRLHDLGIFHFDQIADWSEEQEQWVDGYLKFKGRIARDEWVQQARLLAQGREEEFASRYGAAEKKSSRSRNSRAPQR